MYDRANFDAIARCGANVDRSVDVLDRQTRAVGESLGPAESRVTLSRGRGRGEQQQKR